MQTESNPAPREFSEDCLLLFIGHSDDADQEAGVIRKLQPELERSFRQFLKQRQHPSTFKSLRLWEWTKDLEPLAGGQQRVVHPALDHARIAVFVFRERIGQVTWQELERSRQRSRSDKLRILVLFPEVCPETIDLMNEDAVRGWAELLKRRRELTAQWTTEESLSIAPLYYADRDALKTIALERLREAMSKVLSEDTQPVAPQPEQRNQEYEGWYRAALGVEMRVMKLLGMPDVNSTMSLDDQTFVPLRISEQWKTEDLFDPEKKRTKKQPVKDEANPDEIATWAFSRSRLLLIVGDPGSGKTTLLKYYALCCLDNRHDRLFGTSSGPVRVFYFPLRELQGEGDRISALPGHLARWAWDHGQTIGKEVFDAWLMDEQRRSLVLLDGLDEISDPQRRREVCRWVTATWSGFPSTTFVVTARTAVVYGEDRIDLSSTDMLRADVLPFSEEQQKKFLYEWFLSVYHAERPASGMSDEEWKRRQNSRAEKNAQAMFRDLYPSGQRDRFTDPPEKQGLQEIAAIPMILHLMALLFEKTGGLPLNRKMLYREAMDYLLQVRESTRQNPPPLQVGQFLDLLGPLALWLQDGKSAIEVNRRLAERWMACKLLQVCRPAAPPLASEVCRYLEERAGVLARYGVMEYIFRHKTFQEYLAAAVLAGKQHCREQARQLVSVFGRNWWKETLVFFIAHCDARGFDLFMAELLGGVPVATLREHNTLLRTLIDEAGETETRALCQALLQPGASSDLQLLVLECLKAVNDPEAADSVKRLRHSFDQDGSLTGEAKKVYDMSVEVIRLLDPDERVADHDHGVFYNNYEQDAAYIRIPGGTYIYSENGQEVTVEELYVARYPVTNRQYRSFIAFLSGKSVDINTSLTAKEYRQALRSFAADNPDDAKGMLDYLQSENDLAKLFRSDYDDNRKFNKDDQPVVGVSWYAARAYCFWLSMLDPEGWPYMLPTEQQWEWAAGGKRPLQGQEQANDRPQKVRKYPWGDEPEPTVKHANYDENEGQTTLVGRYPDGATPAGLYDMAGNVWEWMENWADDDKDVVALRGGSWGLNADDLLCSARDCNYPQLRLNDFGFRVVRPSPLPEHLDI